MLECLQWLSMAVHGGLFAKLDDLIFSPIPPVNGGEIGLAKMHNIIGQFYP